MANYITKCLKILSNGREMHEFSVLLKVSSTAPLQKSENMNV